MRSDVRNQISLRSSPLDSIEKRLNSRKDRLQTALIHGREFKDALQCFEDRLVSLETRCSQHQPISAVLDDTERQNTEHEVL